MLYVSIIYDYFIDLADSCYGRAFVYLIVTSA
jgi:hypothetical protein